ncbi:uncharacterized protein METZ01_LOCUS339530 [marine metagenome]|uniref:Prolyl 4-hydroxylase alpha subunit Fe(2+) 2OG dioxygenase domain-containing protein n=1 Tax=marine metagenome TaxID=408172 RepID=A0A382QMK4_9ZZZZ
MLNYILRGGISQHIPFFEPDKFNSIKRDLDRLKYHPVHQPYKNNYGNRKQAFPCYESPYDKENDYITTGIETILQTKITDFKTVARKIILSEVKESPQNFGKYGFIHRDYPIGDREPLIAGMMYFDQAYDGGTAFFNNQMEKVPDIYISAIPNRLVLYHGGIYHAPCLDYTFKERLTLSFFFRIWRENDI